MSTSCNPPVDADGFVENLVCLPQAGSQPGNIVVRICPTCLGMPGTGGHKPDCTWKKSASATQASPGKFVDLPDTMEGGSDSRSFLERLGFFNLVVRQGSNQYSCDAPPETTRTSYASKGYTSYFIKGVHVFDVVWSSPNNSNRFIRPMSH